MSKQYCHPPQIQQALNDLLDNHLISLETLAGTTQISLDSVKAFAAGDPTPSISHRDKIYLVSVIILLHSGIPARDSDDLLYDTMVKLLEIYHMDETIISLYSGLDEEKVHAFLVGYDLPPQEKYELATSVMMLYYILQYPDYKKIPPQPKKNHN